MLEDSTLSKASIHSYIQTLLAIEEDQLTHPESTWLTNAIRTILHNDVCIAYMYYRALPLAKDQSNVQLAIRDVCDTLQLVRKLITKFPSIGQHTTRFIGMVNGTQLKAIEVMFDAFPVCVVSTIEDHMRYDSLRFDYKGHTGKIECLPISEGLVTHD